MIFFCNVATFLTLSRLILGCSLVPFLIWYAALQDSPGSVFLAAAVFSMASFTDFLDGYIARRYNQQTLLGRLLDPLADKLLVSSALIALIYLNKLWFYWGIIFIGREFFVMGLREIALHQGFEIPVGNSGKIKTALQFLLILCLIIDSAVASSFGAWLFIKQLLTLSAIAITLISGYIYYSMFKEKLSKSL
jgi:CDP-diacylglycerol--glycerol-3-phosphate 3-phosphatidyltransferase